MKIPICKFFHERDIARRISSLVDREEKRPTNLRGSCSSDRIRKTFDCPIANYLADDRDGILKHRCYHEPKNLGVDEGRIWGDYYYVKPWIWRLTTLVDNMDGGRWRISY